MTGDQVKRLIGTPPTDPWGKPLLDEWFCSTCKKYVPTDSVAWDTYDYAPDTGTTVECLSCALTAALERELTEAAA